MPRFLFILLILISAQRAAAHVGMENDTEVRVYSDSMRVVIRTSIPFAWSVLGDRAPAMADEAGQAIAKPLLATAAADLLTVTAAGNPLPPAKTECLFEVQNDVALILNFPRPTAWPVVLEARFFRLFGNLETGKIRVFDYTASRFSRNLEPIVEKTIDPRDPTISFTLGSPHPSPAPVAQLPPPPVQASSSFGKIAAVSAFAILAAIIAFLAFRRLKHG